MFRAVLPAVILSGGCIQKLPEVDAPCKRWEAPGLYTYDTTVDGKKRHAYVYVPNSVGPRDLVFAIHGAGQTRREFATATRFIPLADKEGFVVVFPKGTGLLRKSWDGVEEARQVDDVRFLDQLARELSGSVCGADVLGVGFSFGGLMAHRWACEGNQVDAIVPAAGVVGSPTCSGPPIPIRHYHGNADTAIAYKGTDFPIYNVSLVGVEESMEVWRARNECEPQVPPETWVDGDTTCQAWSCAVPTELCTLDGWGHQWPGGANRGAKQHDATLESWGWFLEQEPSP
jgi:polyhydroxybutyrate depolymerase